MDMRIDTLFVQCILGYFQYFFTISIGIGTYFVHYKYMSRIKENVFKYGYVY